MTERLCKDCKHYESEPDRLRLLHLSCYALKGKPHPVFGGDVSSINAVLVRMTLCGWDDPKWWEPRPKE